ncbi:MAG: alpha/beta hydrolase [Chloroflexi bacterium]|nr:alpha/beta hydrolase [Chloroflexota bacterium]
MPYAETARGDLFYTMSQGLVKGPTVVLVHGAGGMRLHWPAELRRIPGATVYTLDLPGHGRSRGEGCDTINGYAEVVDAFIRTVGVEQAIITGHSMGGAIAITLALDFDCVAGLVLVGTGARLRVAPAILDGIHNNFAKSAELVTRFAWSSEAPARLTELGQQALLDTDPDVLWGDFTACDHFDVMDRLSEIQVPTLVITGTADRLTPIKYAHFLAESISGAHLITIDDAGHMVMLEEAVEVGKAVREFLGNLKSG